MKYPFLLLLLPVLLLTSCKKKELEMKDEQISMLKEQVKNLEFTNTNLLDRMADMSIINKAGAESIKQSLDNIGKQYEFIEDLTEKIQHKDSVNLQLVMNLKRSLADVNDEDITVEVRGGVVHVSIADKLMFDSGSNFVNEAAKKILSKIANVIHDHDELEILVEGHTDNVPVNLDCIQDNWGLSVSRATSVVRLLQSEYDVNPERLVAAGRSEYYPKSSNSTDSGRAANRRTEILIQPRLDQFFELMRRAETLD